MVWLSVGAILGFNVCFNYTMACLIKAVGPTDLKKIEQLRKYYKKRASRKEFDDEDKYEDISPNVKATLKYRSKTLDDLS